MRCFCQLSDNSITPCVKGPLEAKLPVVLGDILIGYIYPDGIIDDWKEQMLQTEKFGLSGQMLVTQASNLKRYCNHCDIDLASFHATIERLWQLDIIPYVTIFLPGSMVYDNT